MNAGQDDTMIAIHESALSKIGDVLITLQDETIKRTNDALEAAEARAAQLEAERDELRVKLEEIKSILAGGRTVGGDAEKAYRDAEEIAEDGAESYKAITP